MSGGRYSTLHWQACSSLREWIISSNSPNVPVFGDRAFNFKPRSLAQLGISVCAGDFHSALHGPTNVDSSERRNMNLKFDAALMEVLALVSERGRLPKNSRGEVRGKGARGGKGKGSQICGEERQCDFAWWAHSSTHRWGIRKIKTRTVL